mmetsp:Transcript_59018/g.157081  ORF Transcript_59018/g.157081 Transcript_59018/m.157081 type:complete len:250 (-) Transcript_59018:290-1039(-)
MSWCQPAQHRLGHLCIETELRALVALFCWRCGSHTVLDKFALKMLTTIAHLCALIRSLRHRQWVEARMDGLGTCPALPETTEDVLRLYVGQVSPGLGATGQGPSHRGGVLEQRRRRCRQRRTAVTRGFVPRASHHAPPLQFRCVCDDSCERLQLALAALHPHGAVKLPIQRQTHGERADHGPIRRIFQRNVTRQHYGRHELRHGVRAFAGTRHDTERAALYELRQLHDPLLLDIRRHDLEFVRWRPVAV